MKQLIEHVSSQQSMSLPSRDVAQEKRSMAESLGRWKYRFDLGHGVETPSVSKRQDLWNEFRRALLMGAVDRIFQRDDGRPPLEGKSCLDLACNSGMFSFQLADRGAERVRGIDFDTRLIKQAKFVQSCRSDKPQYANVTFEYGDVYSLRDCTEKYDLICMFGLLYHTTDPLGLLRIAHALTKRCVIVDTAISDSDSNEAVLEIPESGKYDCCSDGEFSFVPNEKALTQLLRKAGFNNLMKIIPTVPKPLRVHYAAFR